VERRSFKLVGIREHTFRAFLIVSAIWLVSSVVLSLLAARARVRAIDRTARKRSL
jgi:hypothetical protein